MKESLQSASLVIAISLAIAGTACQTQQVSEVRPTPSPASSPIATVAENTAVPITLPVLDALLSEAKFREQLKSKLQLNDEQIDQLRKISSDEVAKLRQTNAEEQNANAAEVREHAMTSIRGVVGDKTDDVLALARQHWVSGGEDAESAEKKEPELTMLPGPNAVPNDTRIVVNTPAFRMDLFQNGSLVKSYKIGIGYPEFPLPAGLRKAQIIIFNPTWTPPDSPWVASMKNVTAGEKIEAGSPLNPLGPIKIPIGMPSLIHGGKSPAKIGTFASHGCVGLTNAQVKDFTKMLVQATGKPFSDQTLASYLKDPKKTRTLKLDKPVPVELRYETIVLEDGKLHVYKDVYDQNVNTEANLRAVLSAAGVALETLTEDERAQALDALNLMSAHPRKQDASRSAHASSSASPSVDANNRANENRSKAAATKKPLGKNQKEIVIEIAALNGKGYPGPVNLDTGTGKPATAAGTTKPAAPSKPPSR
jgi:lipoprotein-anchoring transpeptidase ErfK/SrfK